MLFTIQKITIKCLLFKQFCCGLRLFVLLGGGQNLERPNVERPIFRKFETSNIEITKVELFDFSIFEFILHFYDCLNYSNTRNTYMIIYHQIRNL